MVMLSPTNDKNVSLNVTQSCKLPLNLGIDNCGSFTVTDGSVVTLSSGVPHFKFFYFSLYEFCQIAVPFFHFITLQLILTLMT
jgi:hypothetical protein